MSNLEKKTKNLKETTQTIGKKRIVFDVDGTLITTDDPPQPRKEVLDLLYSFYHLGWSIFVHSGGGTAYAANWVRRLNLDKNMFITVCIKGDKKIHYHIAVDDCLDEEQWTKDKEGNYINADYYIKV
jgi:hydroxymethylpyrimidine pyrophosphatase-like HAD family hydrolase